MGKLWTPGGEVEVRRAAEAVPEPTPESGEIAGEDQPLTPEEEAKVASLVAEVVPALGDEAVAAAFFAHAEMSPYVLAWANAILPGLLWQGVVQDRRAIFGAMAAAIDEQVTRRRALGQGPEFHGDTVQQLMNGLANVLRALPAPELRVAQRGEAGEPEAPQGED